MVDQFLVLMIHAYAVLFMKQIRAHAKHIGVPLLGDEVYGGTKSMALSLIRPRIPASHHGDLTQLLSGLERPCLHAFVLGYVIHHKTNFHLQFLSLLCKCHYDTKC